ncbi:MAG: hypothetical protein NTV22_09940 [bacterium]|nr:hypothetical protein [bacterium]
MAWIPPTAGLKGVRVQINAAAGTAMTVVLVKIQVDAFIKKALCFLTHSFTLCNFFVFFLVQSGLQAAGSHNRCSVGRATLNAAAHIVLLYVNFVMDLRHVAWYDDRMKTPLHIFTTLSIAAKVERC